MDGWGAGEIGLIHPWWMHVTGQMDPFDGDCMLDLFCRRTGNCNLHYSGVGWCRNGDFFLPIRHESHWTNPGLFDLLRWCGSSLKLHILDPQCPHDGVQNKAGTAPLSPTHCTVAMETRLRESPRASKGFNAETAHKRSVSSTYLQSMCETEWLISNLPHSLTRNITSHSMKNLAFHSWLRWEMIILLILTTSFITFLFRRLGRCTFWTWGWKD